jgi:hypothetical protein
MQESKPHFKLRLFVDAGMTADFHHFMSTHAMYNYQQHIEITTANDYTHAILFNGAKPQDTYFVTIPKNRVVGLSHEPIPILFHICNIPDFVAYCQKYVGKYFVGDLHTLPSPPFQEGQLFLGHNRPSSIPRHIQKTRFCSLILSGKKMLPGHRYRHQLVEAILQSNLPIDIYGRGTSEYQRKYPLDKRIKGAFPQTTEATHGVVPYADYQFSICIENSLSRHYFSEKIINPLLYGTTPLYLGCQNIEKYLPNLAVPITGVVAKDMKLLRRIAAEPGKYVKPIVLEDVIKRTNIFDNLDRLFDDITKEAVGR